MGDKKWIQKALPPSSKGKLHKELDVPKDKKIPKKKLDAAAKKPGIEGKRARLAETLSKMRKKQGCSMALKNSWVEKVKAKKPVAKDEGSPKKKDKPTLRPTNCVMHRTLRGTRKQMQCQRCSYPHSRVVETTNNETSNQVIRRRECIKCGVRYTTQEAVRGNNYRTPAPKRMLEK